MPSLTSLLLCHDPNLKRVLKLILKDLEIEVEHCETPYRAKQLLSQRRFDAVLVECDVKEENLLFLQNLKKLPYNQRAVLLAMVKEQKHARIARDAGVHFVVEGPVSTARLSTTMRAARNLMNRERRQAFRRPVELLTNFSRDAGEEFDAVILDLSHEGMAIKSHEIFEKSKDVALRFCLPGTTDVIRTRGKVAWCDDYGRCGIRFAQLHPESKLKLDAWLRERRRSMRKVVAQFTAYLRQGEGKEFEVSLLDLSEGGMSIKSDGRLEKGTIFQLRIVAPDKSDSIHTSGKVTWVHERTAGINFIEIIPEHERILKLWTSMPPPEDVPAPQDQD